MGKSKGIIIFVIIIILCVAGGIYFYNQKQTNKDLENELIPVAEEYFDKYMSTNTGSNAYVVTLEDLKKAEDDDYNLDKFKNCKNDTSVTLTIDYNTGKVIKKEAKLNCN